MQQNLRPKKGIRASILMHVAWRNLVSKKLRTILTVVGVIIGIGAIYFLLSFGLGLQKLVTDEIIGNKSLKLVEVVSPNSEIITLDQEMVGRVSSLVHVDEVSVEYSYPGLLSLNGGEIDVVTYGVDEAYADFVSLNLINGRLLNESDTQRIIINTSTLESIGIENPREAIGQTVALGVPLKSSDPDQKDISADFQIVGVIDSGAGSEAFIPSGIFSAAGVDSYKTLRILADEPENVATLRQEIESIGLETQSPADTLDQVGQIFDFFNVIMISFGSIGMLVAVIGMFNTITVSLLERTREIGLMVALGARRADMRKLFIIETTMISVIGAAIGILIAMLSGFLLNLLMNQLAGQRGVDSSFSIFINPPWLIGSMMLFMVIIGLLVAALPSRRAEKINPIDALRHE